MGIVATKIKIMPTSPDINLEDIQNKVGKIIEKAGGKNCSFEVEPIAFGLSALIAFFAWSEDKEIESLEEELRNIEGITSVQIIDMRRAFG